MAKDATSALHRLGRHTLVYGLGILLQKCVSLLLLPLYTHYLTPADYGVLALLEMTISVFSILAGSTLVNGVYRFYHKTDLTEDRERVVSTAFLLLCGTFAVAALLAGAAAPGLSGLIFHSDKRLLIRLAAVNLWLEGVLAVPLAYLRLRDWSTTFVVSELGKLVGQILLNVLFVAVWKWGPEGVLLSGALSNLGLAVVLTYILGRQVPWRFDRLEARRLSRFGAPLIIAHAAAFIITFLDRYFLQASSGSSVVGIYALAYQFTFAYGSLTYAPFAMIWEPMRFEVAQRDDRDAVIARVFVLFNVLIFAIGVAIIVFIEDALRIIATPPYYGAAAIVPILIVASVLQYWSNFMSQGIMMRERTEFWTAGNWAAALVALGGYITLIPRYHAYGAAIATLLAYATRLAIIYPVSQALWRVVLNWRPVGWLAILATGTCAVSLLAPSMNLLPSVAMRVALFVAFVLALWLLPILGPGDRAAIRARLGVPLAVLRISR